MYQIAVVLGSGWSPLKERLPNVITLHRLHAYEKGDPNAMFDTIQSLKHYGIDTLILTNAVGSLDPYMSTGSFMVVDDHINMVQLPLKVGFVDMRHAYDRELRKLAVKTMLDQHITPYEGTLAWMMGPQFETPAEVRMLQALGANAVGMSVVPETIIARHFGMRVLAISHVVNMACGLSGEKLSHEHTLSINTHKACNLVESIVAGINSDLK